MASGPTALVRLASDAGCSGLAIDGGCVLGLLPLVAAESLRAGLPVVSVRAPMPEMKLGADKRLPYLASVDDGDERLAAVRLVTATIEAAHHVGSTIFPLAFGRVTLAVPEPLVRAHFARRELDEGEPGAAALAAAVSHRKTLAPALMDACRVSIERLVRVAERNGVRMAIFPAATPWGAPGPRETLELLREFAGAPLGTVYSPARLAVMGALGMPVTDDRQEALRKAAVIIDGSDAVGLDHSLLAGTGEVSSPAADAPVVLTGPTDTSADALREAIDLFSRQP